MFCQQFKKVGWGFFVFCVLWDYFFFLKSQNTSTILGEREKPFSNFFFPFLNPLIAGCVVAEFTVVFCGKHGMIFNIFFSRFSFYNSLFRIPRSTNICRIWDTQILKYVPQCRRRQSNVQQRKAKESRLCGLPRRWALSCCWAFIFSQENCSASQIGEIRTERNRFLYLKKQRKKTPDNKSQPVIISCLQVSLEDHG